MKIWVGKNKKLTKKKEKNEKKNPTKRCSSKNFFIFPEEKKVCLPNSKIASAGPTVDAKTQ